MDVVGVGVDSAGDGVEPQRHAGRFEVGDGAVGEVAPVGDLAGDVVGDAADREVRVGVGDDDGDLGGRVELPGAQRGADAGVAAADRNQSHQRSPGGRGGGRATVGVGHDHVGGLGWSDVGVEERIVAIARAPPAWRVKVHANGRAICR